MIRKKTKGYNMRSIYFFVISFCFCILSIVEEIAYFLRCEKHNISVSDAIRKAIRLL